MPNKWYIRCWQTNGNAVRWNAFACEIAGLVAVTTYKCRGHRMDSMEHVPDSVQAVYFYKLDPTVDNANYHLWKETKNPSFNSIFWKLEIWIISLRIWLTTCCVMTLFDVEFNFVLAFSIKNDCSLFWLRNHCFVCFGLIQTMLYNRNMYVMAIDKRLFVLGFSFEMYCVVSVTDFIRSKFSSFWCMSVRACIQRNCTFAQRYNSVEQLGQLQMKLPAYVLGILFGIFFISFIDVWHNKALLSIKTTNVGDGIKQNRTKRNEWLRWRILFKHTHARHKPVPKIQWIHKWLFLRQILTSFDKHILYRCNANQDIELGDQNWARVEWEKGKMEGKNRERVREVQQH